MGTAAVSVKVYSVDARPAARLAARRMKSGLANDYAPTAFKQHLTASLVVGTGPKHGTLVLNPNGSLAYSPDQDFSGEDSFFYQACYNSLCSRAVKVTITVTKVPVVIYFPLITR